MKAVRLIVATGLSLVVCCAALAQIAETPWFNLEGCSICSRMGEHPDMMAAMQWETHVTKNGMLMTLVIPEQYQTQWDAVSTKMKAVEEELAAGKELPLCGLCQSWRKLVEAGAEVEDIKTSFGRVELVTSDDPSVIQMIHAHAKRTQDEYKKMLAMEQ